MAKRRGGLTASVKKEAPKKDTTPSVATEPDSRISIEDQEKAIKALEKEKKAKTYTRVSVDFPIELYEQVKEDTKRKGQTLKGFIISLVRDHYEEK